MDGLFDGVDALESGDVLYGLECGLGVCIVC